MVWIIVWRAENTDQLGVGNFFAAVDGDIFIIKEIKSAGVLDSLADTVRSFTDSSTETPKIVVI